MMTPPPPPPPKAGGFPWKWILIGCGVMAFLGLVVCGGCTWWGAAIYKSMRRCVERTQAAVEGSPDVKAEIGAVRKMTYQEGRQTQKPGGSMTQYITVEGERMSGEVEFEMKLENM